MTKILEGLGQDKTEKEGHNMDKKEFDFTAAPCTLNVSNILSSKSNIILPSYRRRTIGMTHAIVKLT